MELAVAAVLANKDPNKKVAIVYRKPNLGATVHLENILKDNLVLVGADATFSVQLKGDHRFEAITGRSKTEYDRCRNDQMYFYEKYRLVVDDGSSRKERLENNRKAELLARCKNRTATVSDLLEMLESEPAAPRPTEQEENDFKAGKETDWELVGSHRWLFWKRKGVCEYPMPNPMEGTRGYEVLIAMLQKPKDDGLQL